MRIFGEKSGLTRRRARSGTALFLALVAIASACSDDADSPNPGSAGVTAGGVGGTWGAGAGGDDTNNGGESERVPAPSGGAGNRVPCNAWPDLCDRRYDEVVYATTHAAMANASPPWDYPAQRSSLHRQLQDGIRALMLEVHERDGELVLCLGDCAEGRVPFASALGEVARFLAENPREVVTLLVDNRAPTDTLAAALDAANLGDSLHFQASHAPWPTLGAMIDEGRRLVVFAFEAVGGPEGLLSFGEFFTSTRDDFATAEALDCELPSGSAGKPLLLVNHFVSELSSGTSTTGTGGESGGGGTGGSASASVRRALPDIAAMLNANPFLIRHLRGCVAMNARKPTFVAVDFYDVGALLPATQELNELIPATGD